jgi:hypothetical protein
MLSQRLAAVGYAVERTADAAVALGLLSTRPTPSMTTHGVVASRLTPVQLLQIAREDGRLLKRHIYLIITNGPPLPALGDQLSRAGLRLRNVPLQAERLMEAIAAATHELEA